MPNVTRIKPFKPKVWDLCERLELDKSKGRIVVQLEHIGDEDFVDLRFWYHVRKEDKYLPSKFRGICLQWRDIRDHILPYLEQNKGVFENPDRIMVLDADKVT